MKGMPEEVIEDPNEQTHSEFQTKRTIPAQGLGNNEKRTLHNIHDGARKYISGTSRT